MMMMMMMMMTTINFSYNILKMVPDPSNVHVYCQNQYMYFMHNGYVLWGVHQCTSTQYRHLTISNIQKLYVNSVLFLLLSNF